MGRESRWVGWEGVEGIVERVPDGPGTVTVEVMQPMRNGEDLRRLTERAAAIADAFEGAASPAPSE